jgi:tRNA A-37 threonylcarbamoyl transferase component Bud32
VAAGALGGPVTSATLAPSERFDTIRRLGAGTTGVVYEALDRQQGTRVAVKTLRHVSAESLARLTREFRTIQGVHHPNLVALGELVSNGPDSFFTMELVEGTDFLEHVRPARTAFDETRLRNGLRQLAEALAALHDAGFVHRDVKPSNVRVTSEGRVVLLDFGLAVEVQADDSSSWTHQAAGTPAYMAPEQVVSTHVDPEADWYALGVMLFEALTGTVPFDGPPLQINTRKQREEPPPPSSVCGAVPADLDALCTALLRFDPDARPTGRQVLRALLEDPTLRSADRLAWQSETTPIVGRAVELDALAAAFRDTRAGAPVTVVVDGKSGLGKTTLVRAFLSQLQSDVPDMVALSARCFERDVAPYRAVREIVDALAALLGRFDPAEARSLLPDEPMALALVFPTLLRVQGIAERARGSLPPFAPLGLRVRAFALLRELLGRLADRRPLVLVIDGAQWADDDSLALLSEVTRAPDAPRLLLVLTTETAAETSPAAGHGRTLADLHGTVRRVALRTLPANESSALAVELLRSAGETRGGMAEAYARQAGGDPFFLELIAHAQTSERIDGEPAFEDVLRSVIQRLDDATRAILETLCVAAVPTAEDVLGRAAGVERSALTKSVSRLALLHMAETTGGRRASLVAPCQERVRGAVLAGLGPTRRIAIHRRIAEAMEVSDPIDPGSLANHWRGAGDLVQARHYARLAGDEAIALLAFDCGARFYELALPDDPGSGDERRSLLMKLGNACANAGWARPAADAFQQAADGANALLALQLRRRATEELLMAGDIEGGTTVLRDVLARVGMWMPSSRLATLAATVFFRAILLLRGMRYVLRDAESVPPSAWVRLHVCWMVARVLGVSDRPVAFYFQTRLLLLALRYAEPNVFSGALALEAAYLASRGIRTRPRTDELLAQAEAIALESSAPLARVTGPRMRGMAAYLQGRFSEALDLNDRATARILETAPEEYFGMRQTQFYSLWALAALGEIKELGLRLTRALREATNRRDFATITFLRGGPFAAAWLRGGDSRALRASVNETMKPWSAGGYNGHHHFACSALAQVDLYEARGQDAFRRIAEDFPRARRAFRQVERVHCQARQIRGSAAVLAAAQTSPTLRSTRKRLVASAAADAAWLRRASPAYAAPWAALVEAGIAGVKGDRTLAETALAEAIPKLDAVSDRLTAAAARMQLGSLRGAEGFALVESGMAFMREQEVADPVRMAAALVPGIGPNNAG